MSIISNVPKLAQQDVFNSFLVRNATYAGKEEIPCVKTSKQLPEKVISFSKSISEQEYDCWIHFYENDSDFERLWKNLKKYLPIIKRYKGIISLDYSLYYDMPLCMQIWNTYCGKALAHWFFENGVEVIPNVRWGDERTYKIYKSENFPNETKMGISLLRGIAYSAKTTFNGDEPLQNIKYYKRDNYEKNNHQVFSKNA